MFRFIGPVLFVGLLVVSSTTNAPASHKWSHPCDSWGSWTETSRTCKQGLFCFGSGQRKTVIYEQRTRQCRNGIQLQKRSRSHCGC
jgi:hypothetical protein